MIYYKSTSSPLYPRSELRTLFSSLYYRNLLGRKDSCLGIIEKSQLITPFRVSKSESQINGIRNGAQTWPLQGRLLSLGQLHGFFCVCLWYRHHQFVPTLKSNIQVWVTKFPTFMMQVVFFLYLHFKKTSIMLTSRKPKKPPWTPTLSRSSREAHFSDVSSYLQSLRILAVEQDRKSVV